MIENIEIIIQNGIRELMHVLILYPEKICYKDNQKYLVNDEFLDGIIRTIRLWKKDYGTSQKLNSEEFSIIVKTKNGEEKMHGKGIFPDNYDALKKLLGDIHD